MVDAVIRLAVGSMFFIDSARLTDAALLFALYSSADVVVAMVTVLPVAGFVQVAESFTQAFPPGENPLTCQRNSTGSSLSPVGELPLSHALITGVADREVSSDRA